MLNPLMCLHSDYLVNLRICSFAFDSILCFSPFLLSVELCTTVSLYVWNDSTKFKS